MNQPKVLSKVTCKNVSILKKNTDETEKISSVFPDKSDSLSKGKVLKTPDTIEKKRLLIGKIPVVSSDKDLPNVVVGEVRSLKRSGVTLSDDSSSSKKKSEESLTPVKVINLLKQNACHDIKVVPNVSNSLKFSDEKLFKVSEKIPPVSTKIIYVGEASQIPIIKQAIAAPKCVANNSAKLILDNAPNVNKEHTLQMKHLSVEKVLKAKQNVEVNPAKVSGTQKIMINLPKDGCVLETKEKESPSNFSESSSTIQNDQLKNIVGNKQIIVLPIKSISELTSPTLQLASFQNSETKLSSIQSFNAVKNVTLKSNSPIKICSPEQVKTSHRLVNTQPIKLIMNKSSSAESNSSTPCLEPSVKKDISKKSIKETEHKYPTVDLQVSHMEPESSIFSALKNIQATCIKSNVAETNNNIYSQKFITPVANVTSSINQNKISTINKNNSHEIRSSVSKINSSVEKKILPVKVLLEAQDNLYKTQNKNFDIKLTCALEILPVSNKISLPNMSETSYNKNVDETKSNNISQFTQNKNQFVTVNKVTDSVTRSKDIRTISLLQPRIILKRLPDAIDKECVEKGYIHLKKLAKMSVLASITKSKTVVKRNKNALNSGKLIKYPVSRLSNVQVKSLKYDELNDSNEGVFEVHNSVKGNITKPITSSLFKKDASALTKQDELPFQPVLPALKKVLPSNMKYYKISAKEMEKLRGCFKDSTVNLKNLCVTATPTDSKQQTPPIQVLVNKNAEKIVKTEAINQPKSISSIMNDKTPMEQLMTKKNTKTIEELLELDKKKKLEKEKIKKKEKILQKMLQKYEEKEEKKQLKYLQKRLSRFIEKYKDYYKGRKGMLMDIVTNSSKLMEEMHNLDCAENDDIRHFLYKLEKKIFRNNDSVIAKPKQKKVIRRQRVQGKQTVRKNSVPSFVNMPTSKIQENKKSSIIVRKEKNSMPKAQSNQCAKNIFSSTLSKDNVYRYDPEGEISRGEVISYSKLSTYQEKVSSKKSASYKLRRRNVKPHADDPFVDLSIITEEKFIIECACQSSDCNGIHPEFLKFP